MKPNITIQQVDPRGPSVTVQLGDGYAVPTVAGGWQDTTRPRAASIAEWTGKPLIAQDIPVMLDGFADDNSVEPSIRQLFSWLREEVGKRDEPPVLSITGVPIPFAGLQWVLNAISPGDEIRREKDGQRVRAAMTLSFLEYREGDVVVSKKSSPAKKHRKKGEHWTSKPTATASGGTQTYNVKHGDSLSSIAAKLLGSSGRWHDIAKLNGIRDPNSIKVGQKIKIPKK